MFLKRHLTVDIARRYYLVRHNALPRSRHRAVRDAATAKVTVTAGQDSVKAAKVTVVLIERCETMLTEGCRYISK